MKIVFAEFPETRNRNIDTELSYMPEGTEVGFAVYDENNLEAYYNELADCDAVITGFAPIDETAIDRMKNCKIISVQATGWNFVAHEYAKSRGIAVSAIGEYCTNEVADHTIMLMLALRKRLPYLQRRVNGEHIWETASLETLGIRGVWGQTLGIVGLGKIGKAVAKRAKPFGMRIIAVDPFKPDEDFEAVGAERVDIDYLLANSDVISSHMDLNPTSELYFDAEKFAKMERKPIFLNVSRGGEVDEDAMLDALNTGKILAVGLDVLTSESPELSTCPFIGREDCIVTPHSAFYSDDSIEACERISVENAVYYINGEPDKVFKLVQNPRK
ncbi:MAG: C-terminal binding protein [Oscillospiraceae bacterium]